MKPVTISGIKINRLMISTRVPGSIEMMFFSVGDFSGSGLSFWELLMALGSVTSAVVVPKERLMLHP